MKDWNATPVKGGPAGSAMPANTIRKGKGDAHPTLMPGEGAAAHHPAPPIDLKQRPRIATHELVAELVVEPLPVAALPISSYRGGMRIGPYLLEELLGEGTTATVWRAIDTRFKRPIALKLFRHRAGMDQAVARVMGEAQSASSVISDHVVRVRDAGQLPDDGPWFIAMELCAAFPDGAHHLEVGQTLETEVPRSLDELVRWGVEIARGVHDAHRVGVFHRDLKPANVIIRPGTRTAQILDFGLATLTRPFEPGTIGAPTRTISITIDPTSRSPRCVAGTPSFMAPEQARGLPWNPHPERDRDLLTRVDVYGIGATLWSLLTGRPPFEPHPRAAHPGLDVVDQVKAGPPVRLSALRTRFPLSRQLQRVLERAMAWNAEDRYPTALALAEDLEAIRGHRPTSADGGDLPLRLGLAVRRRPARVLAMGWLVFLLGGAAWTAWLRGEITDATTRLDEARAAEDQAWTDARTAEAARAEAEQTAQAATTHATKKDQEAAKAAATAQEARGVASKARQAASAAATAQADAEAVAEAARLQAAQASNAAAAAQNRSEAARLEAEAARARAEAADASAARRRRRGGWPIWRARPPRPAPRPGRRRSTPASGWSARWLRRRRCRPPAAPRSGWRLALPDGMLAREAGGWQDDFMSQPETIIRMTEAEYLEYDATHEGKHEFVNGELVAMSGVSEQHSTIQTNLLAELRIGLRGTPCRVHGSDLRVQLDETGLWCYPDISVVCGTRDFAPTRPVSLRNPRMLVEVLSDSTENYDRGAKAAHYRHRASVDTILLVDSRRRMVERQTRNPDGTWTLSEHLEGHVDVLGVSLALDEIYEGWSPPT